MDNEVCCICLESLRIPVEPLSFQCSERQDGQISCFTMKRICLACLEQYLELQKHRAQRPIKKKCIYCPLSCHSHHYHKNKTFRVDYLMMDKDTDIKTCPYCDYQNTHIQVAKHVFSVCPYYHIECECGFTCQRTEMPHHQASCAMFQKCALCQTYVLETDIPRHMYYDHDQTRCFTCHQFIEMNRLSDHIISECPERFVVCDICSTSIRFKVFKNHLRKHIVEINKNVQMIKDRLKEEESLYQKIQKLLAQYTPPVDEEIIAP